MQGAYSDVEIPVPRHYHPTSEWTPRELRHSFVSLPNAAGVRIEDISQLVGHFRTRVTETVYRHELRPVLTRGRPL